MLRKNRPHANHKTAGVVLISVLAVTAVLAAIAWQMVSRQSLLVSGASSASFRTQAFEYLVGGEHYVRQLLVEDWQDEGSRVFDSEDEDWGVTRPPFQVPGGSMEMRVWDLQSRFNLNAAQAHEATLRLILQAHKIPEAVIPEWLDWIDADDQTRAPGAEDMELLLRSPAIRSANQLAAHRTEFQMLPTMADTPFSEVGPLLIALPTDELAININTAGSELLKALGVPQSLADTLTSGERKFTSIDEVGELEVGQGATYFVVTSNYFAVWGEVEIGERRARMESRLYRSPSDGSVHLIGRNLESA